MRLAPLSLAFGLMSSAAYAAPPEVVTDIPPVHSLVALVMGDLGEPELLLPPGSSPHGHQMRPSEARALNAAELLFWIGPAQSPWLEKAAESIGNDLTSVRLMSLDGTLLRVGGHDHDHDHDEDHAETDHDDHEHGEDHAEADHDDHDHAHDEDHAEAGHGDHDHAHEDDHAEAGHDDHDHAHEEDHAEAGHDDHGHDGTDPHVWLNPDNAQIWLPVIAAQLAEADPENAATYTANAEAAMADLAALTAELEEKLSGITAPYVVYHDAYGYFTDRFDLPAAGTIADGEAVPAGARSIADLQASAQTQEVRCLFTEPQFNSKTALNLAETLGAQVGTLDPIGTSLDPGAGLYAVLLTDLADELASCLKM